MAALLGKDKCLEIFKGKFKFQFNQKDKQGFSIENYIELRKKQVKERAEKSSFAEDEWSKEKCVGFP